MIYTEHEYLAHHGVDKQKWGHRNGPPYPLNPEQMTSAQKRANADEGWFKRKIREAKEAKQAKKEAKIAKKEEEKAVKQAHKQGRLSEQERKDVYNRADVKTAYEHISEYSNKEIQSIMDRYEMQKALGEKVSNLNYKEKMKGKEKIDIAAKYIESAVNIGHKAADIYNIAAGVANALGDKEWKPIRIGEFKRKEETGLTQADKNKIINSGDLNLAYKYRNQLSAKELNNVMNKQNMNNKLLNAIVDPYGRHNQDNQNNNQKQNNNNQNNNQKQNNGQQNQNKNQNNYNKSYDNSYSKPKDTTTTTNSTTTATITKREAKPNSGKARGIKSSTWSVVGSTSGNYSDFLSNNASSGESWVSTYFDNYSKPKTRTSLSTNTKTSYSDNHVKDSSGNTYRMITTSPTGLTGVDKNYVTSGENWFSNWSASYDAYDDKKK